MPSIAPRFVPLATTLKIRVSIVFNWIKYRITTISKYYVTESRYPANLSFFTAAEQDLTSDTAIVIRGPIIYDDNFTENTVEIYRALYPRAPIIISTWDYCQLQGEPIINDKNVHIVSLPFSRPKYGGTVNLQIQGNLAGISLASKLGLRYVISTRADQRFYQPKLLKSFRAMINLFTYAHAGEGDHQTKRLITSSLDSFKYRLYGVSDMFVYGTIDDVYHYWNAPLISSVWGQKFHGPHYPESRQVIHRNPSYNSHRTYSYGRWSEIYIMTEYLRRNGVKISWELKQYWQELGRRFIIVDSNSIGQFWPKYTWHENRWSDYCRQLEWKEVNHLEWLSFMRGDISLDGADKLCDNSIRF